MVNWGSHHFRKPPYLEWYLISFIWIQIDGHWLQTGDKAWGAWGCKELLSLKLDLLLLLYYFLCFQAIHSMWVNRFLLICINLLFPHCSMQVKAILFSKQPNWCWDKRRWHHHHHHRTACFLHNTGHWPISKGATNMDGPVGASNYVKGEHRCSW